MNVETDTVLSVMHKIQDAEGIPYNQQRLLFGSIVMYTSSRLSAYKIRVKSTFRLQVCPARIRIETLTGKSFMLDIAWTDTIEDVKQKIEQSWKASKAYQRLIFASQQLEDGHTLLSYDITIESTLYFVERLHGD